MEKNLDYYLGLNYSFIIQKGEDGTFCIKYFDLPGCISFSDTVEKIITMGEDAKKTWLVAALEDGRTIPEPAGREENNYTGNFRLQMPKALHQKLAEHAEAEGISMNQYCVNLLGKEFEREHQGLRSANHEI